MVEIHSLTSNGEDWPAHVLWIIPIAFKTNRHWTFKRHWPQNHISSPLLPSLYPLLDTHLHCHSPVSWTSISVPFSKLLHQSYIHFHCHYSSTNISPANNLSSILPSFPPSLTNNHHRNLRKDTKEIMLLDKVII